MTHIIDARRQTINNVRYTTNNLTPLVVRASRTGIGGRIFQTIGFFVWVLIAIVAIGRCSARAQALVGPMSDCLTFPDGHREGATCPQSSPSVAGWYLPAGPDMPNTLRCVRRGVETVCNDARQETTCRQVGAELVCDRRSR